MFLLVSYVVESFKANTEDGKQTTKNNLSHILGVGLLSMFLV